MCWSNRSFFLVECINAHQFLVSLIEKQNSILSLLCVHSIIMTWRICAYTDAHSTWWNNTKMRYTSSNNSLKIPLRYPPQKRTLKRSVARKAFIVLLYSRQKLFRLQGFSIWPLWWRLGMYNRVSIRQLISVPPLERKVRILFFSSPTPVCCNIVSTVLRRRRGPSRTRLNKKRIGLLWISRL